MPDDFLTFFEAPNDGEPMAHKIERLRRFAYAHQMEIHGLATGAERTIQISFKDVPVPPLSRRVARFLKHVGRSENLRAVAPPKEAVR